MPTIPIPDSLPFLRSYLSTISAARAWQLLLAALLAQILLHVSAYHYSSHTTAMSLILKRKENENLMPVLMYNKKV